MRVNEHSNVVSLAGFSDALPLFSDVGHVDLTIYDFTEFPNVFSRRNVKVLYLSRRL